MKSKNPVSTPNLPHRFIPFFHASLSLLLTVVSALYIHNRAVDRDYLRFQRSALQVENAVTTRMDTYITLLRGGAGLFAANDIVTYPQFANYVSRLAVRQNYPGIQGIGYSQQVRKEELGQLTATMHQQGFSDFVIPPLDMTHDEYNIIMYLEPLDADNRKVIGFDMYSEQARRKAMDQARDTGTVALSDKVHLIQDRDKSMQPGFLIYSPVYIGGVVPATVQERRQRIIGYIYGPFRVNDLFSGIFGEDYGYGADFQLYDGESTNKEHLMYDSRVAYAKGPTDDPRFTYTKTISIGNNPWTITYLSRPEILSGSERNLVPLILAAGSLISLLFYVMTSRLYDSDRQTRDFAERLMNSEKMNLFLADAGKIVISNRTEKDVLKDLAKLSVASFCDWCIWDMKTAENSVCIHKDRKKNRVLNKHCEIFLRDFKTLGKIKFGKEKGTDQIVDAKELQAYVKSIPDAETKANLQKLGMRSLLIVPVILQDEVLGTLCFVRTADSAPFMKRDLDVAQELANRMTNAIEKIYNYRRVQEALRIRDEFLSIASHELKTPITSLNIYLDLLKKQFAKELSKMQITYIVKARSQADKLTNLINDLLDISKIERGKIEYRDDEFDMVAVIQEVVDSIKKAHPTHAIIVNGRITRQFVGDKDRISQVIINLLNNAIKYSPQADRVVISLSQTKEAITIKIQDFGIGIDKRYHKKIFSRFFRASSGDEAANFPGLGIGLYVSYEIVRRHNGTIEVESKVGEGSSFIVKLPFK
ncbi:MAG: CHASE domain-containing protein [Weeksellaceae bacterium]